MPLTCCVIGCGNRGNREQVSFFAIPSNTDLRGREDEAKTRRRQKWINAINRSDLEGTKLKNAKVCAKHFISGKPSAVEYENHPDWAPSQHLGYGNRQLSPTASKMSRYIRYQKRNRMMPRKCCVPGCKANYASTLKKNQQCVTTFLFPKNEEMRGRWLRAIPRKDWFPTATSVVCCNHFKELEIIRFDKYLQPDGTCIPLALRYPKLQKDAVPSLFLNLPAYLSSPAQPKTMDSGSRHQNVLKRILIKDEKEVNSPPLEFVAVEDGTANTSGKLLSETPPENSASKIKGSTPDTCMVIDEPSFSPAKSGIKRKIAAPPLEETVEKLRTVVDDSIPDDEFDRFCKSLACQLRAMPLERALICQEKLQSVMTEERLYQIGASRCGQQSDTARYEIVVKEEDLGTEEPDEYEVIVKEETDIDIYDEFL